MEVAPRDAEALQLFLYPAVNDVIPPNRRRARVPSPDPGPGRYWTDLRVRHRAKDRRAADAAVEALVEAAEQLGFELELARTRPHAPAEPLPD
jgi:hypothetical protein